MQTGNSEVCYLGAPADTSAKMSGCETILDHDFGSSAEGLRLSHQVMERTTITMADTIIHEIPFFGSSPFSIAGGFLGAGVLRDSRSRKAVGLGFESSDFAGCSITRLPSHESATKPRLRRFGSSIRFDHASNDSESSHAGLPYGGCFSGSHPSLLKIKDVSISGSA